MPKSTRQYAGKEARRWTGGDDTTQHGISAPITDYGSCISLIIAIELLYFPQIGHPILD
jgi:hypothetical protein